MQHTDNYNLKKPESTDFYNVTDQNDNMDVVDAEMHALRDIAMSTGHIDLLCDEMLTAAAGESQVIELPHNLDYYSMLIISTSIYHLSVSFTDGVTDTPWIASSNNYVRAACIVCDNGVITQEGNGYLYMGVVLLTPGNINALKLHSTDSLVGKNCKVYGVRKGATV